MGDPIEGMKVRRQVLGDAHVDASRANADEFSAEWQDFITEQAWGAVWTRPGLSLRERSLLTLSLLTALGRDEELPMHVRGAINNGVTPEEIREVIMHTSVYAGIPVANTAMHVAARTLREIQQS
jgi:4-carboxymuconolactone decarboxylase